MSLFNDLSGMIAFVCTDPLFILTVLAMLAVVAKSKFWKSSASVPSMVTSIGVLGTFLGIVFGLWNFDSTDINGSVPTLIEGLKTSFFTSIAGIILSTVLKFYPNIYLTKKETEQIEGATIDTLASLLKEIKNDQAQQSQKLIDQTILSGQAKKDRDQEHLKQLSLLRAEQDKHFENLINEFQTFAKQVAENNTKTFIEALSGVIKDFNEKLTEQFGENFKELNSAVEKLVIWQDQHKDHVELIDKQFVEVKENIVEIQNSFSALSQDAERFSEISNQMKNQNNELHTITTEMTHGLGGLKLLGEQASTAFPSIKSNIEELTTEYSKLIKKTIQDSISEYDNHQKAVTEQINKVHQNFDSLGKKIDRQMDENAERIAKQVEVLDKQLEEELNKALQSLGTQLGSLSNKFVQDYSQLADALETVVKSTNRIA